MSLKSYQIKCDQITKTLALPKVAPQKSTSYAIKTANYIEANLCSQFEAFGVGEGNSAFMTLTFKKKIRDLKEANKIWGRFKDLLTRHLRKENYDLVLFRMAEPHKDGAWHFHSLISCPPINGNEKTISTKRLHDMYNDIKKATGLPLGWCEFKWTYHITDKPIKGMKSKYYQGLGKTMTQDRTPSHDPEHMKGSIKYITKYVLKGLVELKEDTGRFIIPKGSRFYSFSSNFKKSCSRKFTSLTPAFYNHQMWCNQVKIWYFYKSWEKFYWHRYKVKEDNYKHNQLCREIIDRLKEAFNHDFDVDKLKLTFDSIADILIHCPAVKKEDIEVDRVRFLNRCLWGKKKHLTELIPETVKEMSDDQVNEAYFTFGNGSAKALMQGEKGLLLKIGNYLKSIKDKVDIKAIKTDLNRLKMMCENREVENILDMTKEKLYENYLRDVPF